MLGEARQGRGRDPKRARLLSRREQRHIVGPFAQPADQIGKNSLRVWRPFASLYVVNFKTEATELLHHVGNIFAGGLDHDPTVPTNGTKQL